MGGYEYVLLRLNLMLVIAVTLLWGSDSMIQTFRAMPDKLVD